MFRPDSPRVSLFVCGLALAIVAATAPFRAAAPEPTRALWVTRTTLTSPDSIRQMVTAADAHAAGLRVHAWVAVNLVSSSVSLPASRDHVIYRAPEWLMVPRELAAEMKKIDLRSPAYIGRLARWTRAHTSIVEGLYTSPLHPAAARPHLLV